MVIKKPNFFICGSPKCGTTSLYYHLKDHPEIFMSEVKEPGFFSKDVVELGEFKTKENYLSLFNKVKDEKVIGEATTNYFVSDIAPKQIKKFNPKAKIIIMLRDRAEVLYSFFIQKTHHTLGGLKIKDFEQWFVERIIKKNGHHWKLIEQERQVKIYRDIFKKNLLVVRLEDYSKNPKREYKKILKFLKVDSNFEPDFKVYNKRRKYKSKFIRNLFLYLSTRGFTKHIKMPRLKKKIMDLVKE